MDQNEVGGFDEAVRLSEKRKFSSFWLVLCEIG
jgi:hypothetical protein